MTNQLLSRSSLKNRQNTATYATPQPSDEHQMTQVKEPYPALQQVKYLHLKAEIDILLQQLQCLKQN